MLQSCQISRQYEVEARDGHTFVLHNGPALTVIITQRAYSGAQPGNDTLQRSTSRKH